ncbi:hypothetical protein Aduo_018680 [Ancylostoma duodenale]
MHKNKATLLSIWMMWVSESVTKKRGWNDKNIPRFPSAFVYEEFSCGKAAAKDNGAWAIVTDAITEECAVPGCTKVVISRQRSVEQHYHADMNQAVFEDWRCGALPVCGPPH